MENTGKNTGGVTGKGFDVSGQPHPEQKKAGWERRRVAQEMMDLYEKYQGMNYAQFLAIKKDIKLNPESYTVREVDMFRYARSPKFVLHRIELHISKAPQNIEMTGKDGGAIETKQVLTPEQREELSEVFTKKFEELMRK